MVSEDEVNLLRFENIALKDELRTYRDAARLYGVDPETMLTLARVKSKPVLIIFDWLRKCRKCCLSSNISRKI